VAIGSSLVNDIVGRGADRMEISGTTWHSDGGSHVL
jgi:hypothetical protein